jgi:hypothetical protein
MRNHYIRRGVFQFGKRLEWMPKSADGIAFIVFARDDLSGWVEARALERNDARSVARLLYEDVICRHGYPLRIVIDGGSENKGVAEALLNRHRISDRKKTCAYCQLIGKVLQRRARKMAGVPTLGEFQFGCQQVIQPSHRCTDGTAFLRSDRFQHAILEHG